MKRSIFVGFDTRHVAASVVSRRSIIRRLRAVVPVCGIVLDDLRRAGVYNRPTELRTDVDGARDQLWDVISEAPMSTEFAISRFLTPWLAGSGLAAFLDCDIMARVSLTDLFDLYDPRYAVMCVKHRHDPVETVKMGGQVQTMYPRKNWSSVMLFNCDHPANQRLTVKMINERPGRDLHAFCWLEDDEIGELPPQWNYLVGHSKLYDAITPRNPAIVHWTDGYPLLDGYRDAEFAEEFFDELTSWAK